MCCPCHEERKEGIRRQNTNARWDSYRNMGDGAYKYLGVQESHKIKMEEMNLDVRQDYYRKVRKVLESSLNRGNTLAVASVRYTECIVDWTVDELKIMDKKTRQLMTLNGALHPRSDVDRLW